MFPVSENTQRVFLGIEAMLITAGVVYHWYCLRSRWNKRKNKASEKAVDKVLISADNDADAGAYEIHKEVEGYLTPEKLWNTAIFFPDPLYILENSKARQFIWYLQQARSMIKICMFASTFKMFDQVLFDMAKRGVRVVGVSNASFTVYKWKKNGIIAREKPKLVGSIFTENAFVDTMHNKFIIIDDNAVMAGSLNWTKPGITENQENVVITTHENIVPKYIQEFERIWKFSEPDRQEKAIQRRKKTTPANTFNIREPKEGWFRLRY